MYLEMPDKKTDRHIGYYCLEQSTDVTEKLFRTTEISDQLSTYHAMHDVSTLVLLHAIRCCNANCFELNMTPLPQRKWAGIAQ